MYIAFSITLKYGVFLQLFRFSKAPNIKAINLAQSSSIIVRISDLINPDVIKSLRREL